MSARYRIFLPSVQKELAKDRQSLKTFILNDALCANSGLRPPEFRQDACSLVQTLWRPAQCGSTEGSVAAQVGTKLVLSKHQVEYLSNCLEYNEIS
jgi:hypothetical protein